MEVISPCHNLDLQPISSQQFPLPSELRSPSSAPMNAEGRPMNAAALKVQKVYRSYRTRRQLADSAVVAEELWWQAINFARQSHNTISFFNYSKPEAPAAKWNRVSGNASKVGKGLSKDTKAKKLAFQHWIEAIDPRHRYGHNLHYYYDEWIKGDSGEPFFYWLDVGGGRNVDIEKCRRSSLKKQYVRYLGPQERELYEYLLRNGKIIHAKSGEPLHTTSGHPRAKWIFVMSSNKKLYAGVKKKGEFHHSSFLAGGVTLAAGRLDAENGVLKKVSAYSGHYRPTDENLEIFLIFLRENGVNLNEVEVRSSSDDESNGYKASYSYAEEFSCHSAADQEASSNDTEDQSPDCKLSDRKVVQRVSDLKITVQKETEKENINGLYQRTLSAGLRSPKPEVPPKAILHRIDSKSKAHSYQLGHQLSLKWCSGLGPRIGCVADYPKELRFQALEFVNLSPRVSSPSASRFLPTSPATQHSAPILDFQFPVCDSGAAQI